MSADNWTTCPRCYDEALRAFAAERERVAGLYGTVPVEEFDAARSALREPESDDYTTFREDYEFYGADEGEVHASYRGACSACGLDVDLDATKRFWSSGEVLAG